MKILLATIGAVAAYYGGHVGIIGAAVGFVAAYGAISVVERWRA